MKVNELARAAGVPPHVVRYYARIGLLRPLRDPANGYRVFSREDVERLRLIRGLRSLGCSLAEVRRVLEAAEGGSARAEQVIVGVLAHRRERTRRELAALQARERVLSRLLAQGGEGMSAWIRHGAAGIGPR